MTSYWARPGAEDEARRAELLVLDIDGVLLDPRPSFYEAARRTSSWAAERILGRDAGPAVSDDEVGAFKAVGGWNDDFDLACAMSWGLVVRALLLERPSIAATAARVGGGLAALERYLHQAIDEARIAEMIERCSMTLIRARSAAHYAGRDRCREMYGLDPAHHEEVPAHGLWSMEPLLCDPSLLRKAPLSLAFFTGRNAAEAGIAIERFELSISPELRSIDDGLSPRKPAPDGLLRLAQGRTRPVVFIGDSVDDQRAALAYRSLTHSRRGAPVLFARVIGPDASPENLMRAKLDGADFVLSSLDQLLTNVWKEVIA